MSMHPSACIICAHTLAWPEEFAWPERMARLGCNHTRPNWVPSWANFPEQLSGICSIEGIYGKPSG
eukprot:scaffold159731_cov19-Tisochrysis_lutea.AAC.1